MGTLHRCTTVSLGLLLAAACAKNDTEATSDSASGNVAVSSTGMAAEPIELSRLAGKWELKATPEEGADTTTHTYILTANSDTTGWTIAFPGRAPVPLHVVVAGDSIVTHAGPYDSFRRKGVKVRTEGVIRMDGERLVGKTTARFVTTGADSVLHLRTEGTRMP